MTTQDNSTEQETVTISSLNSLPGVSSIDLSGLLGNMSTASYNFPTYSAGTGCVPTPTYGNVTIGNIGTQPYYSVSTQSSDLTVRGDAEFDGDIKWKGRSLGSLLEKIENRLAILTPDSGKLEHFAALKKAYDHYKALEALCELPKEEEDEQ